MAFAPTETFFDEILEFLASSPTAQEIIDYQPPITLQREISGLLEKNRTNGLTESECHELSVFMSMY